MKSGPSGELREPARAVVAAERVERRPQVGVGPVELVAEDRPAARVGGRRSPTRTARSLGSLISAGLHDTIRTHGRPLAITAGNDDHVVLDDDVGLELADDLLEPRVDVLRAVDERLPGRRDELAELLERRLAEDRRRVADEVDPELAGDLGLRGRRAEAHQALLEALGLEVAGERLLDDEHDPVAAPPQHVADARRSCSSGRRRPRGRTRSSGRRPRWHLVRRSLGRREGAPDDRTSPCRPVARRGRRSLGG